MEADADGDNQEIPSRKSLSTGKYRVCDLNHFLRNLRFELGTSVTKIDCLQYQRHDGLRLFLEPLLAVHGRIGILDYICQSFT